MVLATLLVSYFSTGALSVTGILTAQRSNYALWLLDFIPFAFVLLGQYSGTIITREAGVFFASQADLLHEQTSEFERQLAHEASRDALTELPNRVAFYAYARQVLEGTDNADDAVAVLLLDLDRFKEINETLGYFNGDHLLRQLGGRLRAVVREPCLVARLGGDEFAILVVRPPDDVSDPASQGDAVEEHARQIRGALAAPFAVEHLTLELDVSMGAAWAPVHGKDPNTLLRRAELAMYSAKHAPTGYCGFSPELDRYNPRRLTLIGELRRAINADELLLYYQPKVDMATARICGAEALIRWSRGASYISPDEFIPLAETTRLIKPLTTWVLSRALRQVADWRAQGLELDVAVNLSARDLHDRNLPRAYQKMLEEYRVDPSWVILEITETSIMVDQHRSLQVLSEIHALGTRLVIDDFGTGHSSLAYLSRLPVSALKIDRSFVMGMTERRDNEAIVTATIDLAHNLGLSVTGEGVETAREWTLLQSKGCDHAQGFYIAKALSAEGFEEFAKESSWGLSKPEVRIDAADSPGRIRPGEIAFGRSPVTQPATKREWRSDRRARGASLP